MARREPRWQSFVLSLDRPFLITANAAFTARALRRAGAFDPDFATAEDVDFGWRVRASGLELRYAPDAVVRHRLLGPPGSCSASKRAWVTAGDCYAPAMGCRAGSRSGPAASCSAHSPRSAARWAGAWLA